MQSTQQTRLQTNILISLALMAALTGLFFLAEQAIDTPLPAFDVMDMLIRELPGGVITFGIDMMSEIFLAVNLGPDLDETAKTAEQVMAVLLFVGLGTVFGLLYIAVADRLRGDAFRGTWWATGLAAGGLFGALMALISAEYNVSAEASAARGSVVIVGGFFVWGVAHAGIQRRLFALEDAIAAAKVQAAQETPSTQAATASANPQLYVMDRRQFLIQVGASSATITLVGAGLGAFIGEGEGEDIQGQGLEAALEAGGYETPTDYDSHMDDLTPAPGTRPEYTPLEDHYRIDINSGRVPRVERPDYSLTIGGLVAAPLTLTYADIAGPDIAAQALGEGSEDEPEADATAEPDTAQPAPGRFAPINQFVTLSCISNRIAGSLISTTRWTGIPMQDLLNAMDLDDDAAWLRIESVDGFYEYVSIEDIMTDRRVMLTFLWDGVPLPDRHGWPLRIYIPNRYGMKQPKWITGMEVVADWEPGYWVERGWSSDAFVRMTSVIDHVAVDELIEQADGSLVVPIGGIAYSGARQIARVEVRVDEGEWQDAQIKTPLSDTTWVVWRYDWPFEEGEHTFTVRAYDGEGELQIEETSGVRPDGATGYHEVSEELSA